MADLHLTKARAWLQTAQSDLEKRPPAGKFTGSQTRHRVYHCQQAAEKAVKGFLLARGQVFEKVHDIERLVAQAARLENRFSEFDVAAAELTPRATAYRYPDEAGFLRPTQEEFDQAVEHAQAVYYFVLRQLPPEARP